MSADDIIVYLLIVLFAAMGIALLLGKGSWLISGYNTASKEEKEKYDKNKLCRATGLELLFITAILAITKYIDTDKFASYMIIPIFISIGVLIWFCNVKCKK